MVVTRTDLRRSKTPPAREDKEHSSRESTPKPKDQAEEPLTVLSEVAYSGPSNVRPIFVRRLRCLHSVAARHH
jgi:hypothetical protein